MTFTNTLPAPSKGPMIASWIIQVLLAVAFLTAAGAKIAGVPMLVDEFQQIGLGQAFRYVTAAVEIIGAIALLVPGFAVLGALWLGATMAVATIVHLTILHTSPVPAIVLVVLCALVVYLRRGQLATLRSRFL